MDAILRELAATVPATPYFQLAALGPCPPGLRYQRPAQLPGLLAALDAADRDTPEAFYRDERFG